MIRLIGKDQVETLSIGGTTFQVRVLSHGRARALRVKHTQRGVLDVRGLERAILCEAVAGWDGLLGVDGSPVAYAPETVPDVVDALPDFVVNQIMARASGADAAVAEALGNLNGSSDSA